MSTDKIRSEFELWYWGAYGDAFECLSTEALELDSDGEYENEHAKFSFIAWQASREALVIELPKIVDKEWANTHAERSAMREAIGWCKKRIEAAGLKVKP